MELTFTSNAIEGDTLTRAETALVLEKGLTVGGKPFKDHVEAYNHQEALAAMKGFVHKAQIDLNDILYLHKLILKGLNDTSAGSVRTIPVRISGSIKPTKTPGINRWFYEIASNKSGTPHTQSCLSPLQASIYVTVK